MFANTQQIHFVKRMQPAHLRAFALCTVLLGACMFGFLLGASFAEAQSPPFDPPIPGDRPSAPNPPSNPPTPGERPDAPERQSDSDSPSQPDRQPYTVPAALENPPLPEVGCNPIGNMSGCVAQVGIAILSAMFAVVAIAGILLNFAVEVLVVEMGRLVLGIPGITVAWITIRDIGNIVLIFALLVIGIGTILRFEAYGMKRLLVKLIIAALLINFSLFFAKAVIDVSNIFAAQIHTAMQPAVCNIEGREIESGVECLTTGLSYRIGHLIELPSLYDGLSGNEEGAGGIVARALLISLLGSVFALILAFVFFAGAIMLVIRFIVLVFLMILSPVGIVGVVLPQTQKLAKDWWLTLFRQAFFAPAFLLLMFISTSVALGVYEFYGSENAQATFANAFTGGGDIGVEIGIVLNFFIIIGLLIASMITAKHIGSKSAVLAMTAGAWAGGFAGRQLPGRVLNRVSQNEWMKRQADKSLVGRLALRSAQAGAKGSWDFRNLPGMDKTSGYVGKGAGKGGFKAQVAEKAKREAAFAESLGQPKEAVTAQQEIVDRYEEDLKAKQSALNRAKRDKDELETKRHEAIVSDAQDTLNREKETLQSIATSRQRRHAERLSERTYIPVPESVTIRGERRSIPGAKTLRALGINQKEREAARLILENAKKDKNTKILEQIREETKKND